jgi:hypothetical protein
MKVKKYLQPEKKENKVDHTSHYEQVAKGLRRAKRHVCKNCPDDVCREQNRHKHHLYMKQEEEQSPSIDYIVVAMRDSLYYQTTHAKFFSSHLYEKQKLMEKMMSESCQTCTTW